MAKIDHISLYRSGRHVISAKEASMSFVVWAQLQRGGERQAEVEVVVLVLDDASEVAISLGPSGMHLVTHHLGEPSVFEQLGQV